MPKEAFNTKPASGQGGSQKKQPSGRNGTFMIYAALAGQTITGVIADASGRERAFTPFG